MGLGTPAQLVELVARGVDMFDCVLPTRVARNGTAFTRKGSISIKGGACKADFRPIEEDCDCYRVPQFHARLPAAPAERRRNPRPAHAQRPQYADVSPGHGGNPRRHPNGTFADYRREFAQNYVPTKKVLLARAAEADR